MIKEEPKWKRELMNLIGLSSMVIGIVLIISSKMIISGNSVIESIIKEQFSTIGIILFIGGIVVLFTSSFVPRTQTIRGREGGLASLVKERVTPIGEASARIVFDTSFLSAMEREGRTFQQGVFGPYEAWIPGKVLSESNKRGGGTNQPLVTGQLRNYLLGPLKTKIKDYRPGEQTVREVMSSWLKTTKGRRFSIDDSQGRYEQGRFREGADMQILGLAYDRAMAGDHTVILANDNDIIETADLINRKIGRKYLSCLRTSDVF